MRIVVVKKLLIVEIVLLKEITIASFISPRKVVSFRMD